MNLEELVEDADNDDGDPSNQYEARSEEPNENRESNNEADVGVFNEDRASSLSLGRNPWDWSNCNNQRETERN